MNSYIITVLAAAVFLVGLVCRGIEQPQDVREWEIGTTSLMFDEWSQEEFNQFAADGIKYLELYMGSQKDKTDDAVAEWVADIKEKSGNAGLSVWSVHLPFGRALDISSLNEEDRTTTIREHARLMELLRPLGVQKYIIHGSFEPIADEERQERLGHAIESLKILTEEVKKHDAELAIEVLPRTCLGNTSEEILAILDAVGIGLRVCFDSNHLLQETPEEFVARVGSAIATVHISDYDAVDERHWIPGRGIIDWTRVVGALVDAGYEGPWMYEVVRRRDDDPVVTTKSLVAEWHRIVESYLVAADSSP